MPAPTARRLVAFTFALALLATGSPAHSAPAGVVKKPSPYATSQDATAPAAYLEDLGGAKVDWAVGRIAVSGVGTPGDRGPVPFRRKLAERAAIADAYRHLASALELVRVDTNQHVKDLIVLDDSMRTRLNDYVKTAKVLETNYWPDGTAEVVLDVPLRGDRSLQELTNGQGAVDVEATASASPKPSPSPSPSPKPSPTPDADSSPTMDIVTTPVPIHAVYTSLIVDAHGLGANPALVPNVRDHANKVIELGTEGARTYVKYFKEGAELDSSAGLNPLTVRAIHTQGPLRADLVLSPDSADALKKALVEEKLPPGTPLLIRL